MYKKFTTADKLLFAAAILSLIFSEVLYFQGEKADGTFIGLWVPSILAFGIYVKLINNTKMIDFIPYFAALITLLFGIAFISYPQDKKCLKIILNT